MKPVLGIRFEGTFLTGVEISLEEMAVVRIVMHVQIAVTILLLLRIIRDVVSSRIKTPVCKVWLTEVVIVVEPRESISTIRRCVMLLLLLNQGKPCVFHPQ